jgi:hypothetical protein
MRKSFSLVLGFVIAAALVAAQGHDNATERKASDLMIVPSEVMIGTHVLRAGNYRVVCDTRKITFIRLSDNRIALEATCKGKELAAAPEVTTMYTETGKDGQRHVVKLLLRGSNVEHVFE